MFPFLSFSFLRMILPLNYLNLPLDSWGGLRQGTRRIIDKFCVVICFIVHVVRTQNFSKNKHVTPMLSYPHAIPPRYQGVRNTSFFENFCSLSLWIIPNKAPLVKVYWFHRLPSNWLLIYNATTGSVLWKRYL